MSSTPARRPLLLSDKVPADGLATVEPGARVLIEWDGLDPHARSEALEIHSVSGWRVLHDYRPDGSTLLCLVGTNWKGEKVHMPIEAGLVRVERAVPRPPTMPAKRPRVAAEWYRDHATPAELRAALGEGWAVCRKTPRNLERYGRCVSKAEYRRVEARILASRQAA